MKRSMIARSAVLLAFLIICAGGDSSGCLDAVIPPPDGGCDTLGRPAILLTVGNEHGDVLSGFLVSVTHGGRTDSAVCTENCQNFPIGVNLFGQFQIAVQRGGYLPAQRTVNIASNDNCNPIQQNVIIVLEEDDTVAALAGAWRAQTMFGQIDLRFGNEGEIIGAVLYDRTIAGDGNFYISYNNHMIRGVPGQNVAAIAADDPTRVGDSFEFVADTLGVPVGFQDATMSADLSSLTGGQPGAPGFTVTYERLQGVPVPLQDP